MTHSPALAEAHRALGVLTRDPTIRAWLAEHDPMALDQAERAFQATATVLFAEPGPEATPEGPTLRADPEAWEALDFADLVDQLGLRGKVLP